jgi:tetratricopeptide (TPR) repeat protein
MLCEARMPLHPAPNTTTTASKAAVRIHFQSHFTAGTIEVVNGLATSFSERFWFIILSTMRAAIGCALVLGATRTAAAETNFAGRAGRAFEEARKLAGSDPTNAAILLQLARASFDWAEFATNDEQRESIAFIGVDAARKVIANPSTNAAAHYWLGMNLGQLARTKLLGALKIVREMEEEFLRARSLDPHVDYAGPDRSLGYLYRDAPGWPTSLGNKKKAREHLERAIQLHPEFPDNQLALLESFEQWADKRSFAQQLPITEKAVADARKKFTGESWEASWADWNRRLSGLKSKSGIVGRNTPSKGGK